MSSILEQLTDRVKSICSRGVSSPIEISKIQIEIENEVLQLKLEIAKQTKERALEYYKIFRRSRWEGDVTMTYNEASSEAKSLIAVHDQNIAQLKAYRDYFDNLGSIIKSFQSSFFRD